MIQPPDPPATPAQPYAEIGFFPGDQPRIESIYLLQGAHTHQCIPSAGTGFADRRVPFPIAEAVIDGRLREAFAPAPERNCHIIGAYQEGMCRLDPAFTKLTITVDELHMILSLIHI